MKHKITIINKETEKLNTFFIESTRDYIEYIKEVFESDKFFIELEPLIDILSLQEYKEIITSNPEAKNIIFPKNVETAEELDYWVQSWKVLEEIYELSLLN